MSDADLKRLLRESEESRKRAWRALQGIRAVVRAVDECPLNPPSRPSNFEVEGHALQRAVAETAFRLISDLENLKDAIEAIRPSIGSAEKPDNFPQRLIALNRAMVKARVAASSLEAFRK
jgi:hypothetical protein